MKDTTLKQEKPVVLILSGRDLTSAPRIYREIEALKKDYTLLAVGVRADEKLEAEFIHHNTLNPGLLDRGLGWMGRKLNKGVPHFSFQPSFYRKLKDLVRSRNIRIVIAHGPDYLPYLSRLKKELPDVKTVYNAHEYHPLEREEEKDWNHTWQPFYEKLYRNHLPNLDLLINVGEGIGDKCKTLFGKESLIIPNATHYTEQEVYANEGFPIRLIHHGGCQPNRKIEDMIAVAEMLGENYTLDLMLTNVEEAYFRKINERAGQVPNVRMIPPVAMKEIPAFINKYDVGIYILPPINFNNEYALPNKFFEYIQARLCIAVSPSPEMARLVRQYELGGVADSYTVDSLASVIRSLDRTNILHYKQKADKAARELNAESYNTQLLKAIQNL